MIKLRWLVLCDEHGRKMEPRLQFLDMSDPPSMWEDVDWVEMQTWEYNEAKYDTYGG